MSTFTKAKEELNKILRLFESGKIVDAVAISTLPPLNVPSARWSLQNRVLQFLAETSDARGFKQWNEAGRKVKKGAKAFYILGPVIKKLKTEDEETGEEKELDKLCGFKTIPVFRMEDTEGEPLSTLEPPQPPPLIEVAKNWGVSVSYHSFAGSKYGYFSPAYKDIVLATHDESVFFHELAHAAHAKVSRLRGGQHWEQEITAELTAAVLMRLYGRRCHDGNAYEYISHYAEKAEKSPQMAYVAVLKDVELVLSLIFSSDQKENHKK